MQKYERVIELMNEKGLNKTQLAMASGILPCHIYQAFNGKKNFFPKWRKAVSEVLEVEENELFPEFVEDAKGENENVI